MENTTVPLFCLLPVFVVVVAAVRMSFNTAARWGWGEHALTSSPSRNALRLRSVALSWRNDRTSMPREIIFFLSSKSKFIPVVVVVVVVVLVEGSCFVSWSGVWASFLPLRLVSLSCFLYDFYYF